MRSISNQGATPDRVAPLQYALQLVNLRGPLLPPKPNWPAPVPSRVPGSLRLITAAPATPEHVTLVRVDGMVTALSRRFMDEQGQILKEDRLVVEALQGIGVYVDSSEDLVNTGEPYPKAIPVLLEMLRKVQTYAIKGIIVRSLGVREAKGQAEASLISEFEFSLADDSAIADDFRWKIANTFEILGGGKGSSDALLRFLRDPRSGSARGMLSLAAAKTKDRRLIPILLESLEMDDFLGFAARGLGILRAQEAIPKLKELAAKTKNGWVRREALTALRHMGVDTEGVAAAKRGKTSTKPEYKGSSGPLVEQLHALAECGIRLSPDVTPELLAKRFSPEGSEKDSSRLLCVLGEEINVDPENDKRSGYFSDDIWHFDTECIEGDGSYAAIAERMSILAKGDLPLRNVEDDIDLEEGVAWLSFTLDGQRHKWPLKVDDDWVVRQPDDHRRRQRPQHAHLAANEPPECLGHRLRCGGQPDQLEHRGLSIRRLQPDDPDDFGLGELGLRLHGRR